FGIACIVIITSFVNVVMVGQLDDAEEFLAQELETRAALTALHRVSENLTAAESGMRGFVITGRDEYLTFYEYVTGSTGKQKAATSYPAQGALIEDIGTLRHSVATTPAQRQRLELLEQYIHDKVLH